MSPSILLRRRHRLTVGRDGRLPVEPDGGLRRRAGPGLPPGQAPQLPGAGKRQQAEPVMGASRNRRCADGLCASRANDGRRPPRHGAGRPDQRLQPDGAQRRARAHGPGDQRRRIGTGVDIADRHGARRYCGTAWKSDQPRRDQHRRFRDIHLDGGGHGRHGVRITCSSPAPRQGSPCQSLRCRSTPCRRARPCRTRPSRISEIVRSRHFTQGSSFIKWCEKRRKRRDSNRLDRDTEVSVGYSAYSPADGSSWCSASGRAVATRSSVWVSTFRTNRQPIGRRATSS